MIRRMVSSRRNRSRSRRRGRVRSRLRRSLHSRSCSRGDGAEVPRAWRRAPTVRSRYSGPSRRRVGG